MLTFMGELHLDEEVTCEFCSASVHFKDLRMSGEALIEHLMKIAAKKFHGDPTYRPRLIA